VFLQANVRQNRYVISVQKTTPKDGAWICSKGGNNEIGMRAVQCTILLLWEITKESEYRYIQTTFTRRGLYLVIVGLYLVKAGLYLTSPFNINRIP
jgi:hypothetical protein